MYICIGERMQGREIEPRAVGKVKQGRFYIPDCQDYKPRIKIPVKVRMDEILTAWNCRNCKKFRPS